jgi:hypothetical protein
MRGLFLFHAVNLFKSGFLRVKGNLPPAKKPKKKVGLRVISDFKAAAELPPVSLQ